MRSLLKHASYYLHKQNNKQIMPDNNQQLFKPDEQSNKQNQHLPVVDPNPTKLLGNYVLGKTVGKGTFGKVKLATHTITGEKVAIKILQKERIVDVADVERVSRQIHILKLIRHPAIIQLYQIIETPKHLFLVMEYVENGELFEYIVKKKKIPEDEACRFFQQIVGGVQYLHKLNIVHRDLKPENLLLSYDNTLRLVDFGLSNTYRNQQRLKTACGSPCYAAPEMIEGKNKYEPLGVDVWSCGVILYAMLCGCLPFEDNDTSKLYQKILAGQYKMPKHLSIQAKDFLDKILTVNPEKRITIEKMRQHPWWKKAILQNSFTHGIIIGYHRIPVDPKILAETILLGNSADFTKKCLQANRHNSETTTYYLLLKKHIKNGGISETYMGSKHFNPALIQHLKPRQKQSDEYDHFSKKKSQQLDWLQTPMQRKKMPSFSFNVAEKKNKTLEVRVRQTLYEPRRESLNKAERQKTNEIQKPKSSNTQFSRQSPAMTIKQYQNQFQTLNLSTVKQNQQDDKIQRKYRELYGGPLVSKSKEARNNSRNKSGSYDKNYPSIKRRFEETNRTKFKFNQTINSHDNGEYPGRSGDKHRNRKVYHLGNQLGFDDDKLKNLNHKHHFNPIKMPYLRKVVFH